MSNIPAVTSADSLGPGSKTKKSRESFSFPGRHQMVASTVYRKCRGYRDNSSFLETLFNSNDQAICFTRPMQLGKTTLFSLAEEIYSINEESNVDTDLEYFPGEDDRNQWYVLRLDFGFVCPGDADANEEEDEWLQQWKVLDKKCQTVIKHKVISLLVRNPQLHVSFKTVSHGVEIKDQEIGEVVSGLCEAVRLEKGRLLILVDEYDQPVREGLLQLIPSHGSQLYESVAHRIRLGFRHYFSFFRAVKTLLAQIDSKIWLTGITPIGIKEMTGLNVTPVTFSANMANAVGLTDEDVKNMLAEVNKYAPFRDGELEFALDSLRHNFNYLRFPHSVDLYHTALVNRVMNILLDPDDLSKRREFLSTGRVPPNFAREPVTSSIFNVLCNARNLRHVVNTLADGGTVSGPKYKLNEQLSLEHILRDAIDIGDYLTLLVHVGVVSVVSGASTASPTFSITSEFYREDLLEPLLKTLRASLESLVALKSTEDLYAQGEEILVDFVTSISRNNMTKLMAWASSDANNHILELQFQSYIVTEAHDILQGRARTSQEDILPKTEKRTDVTFSSKTSVVILELKQVASAAPPTTAFLLQAHKQLSGYVKTRQLMEDVGKCRPVAGFVVVMYNDGADYVVEKLRLV